MRYCKAFLPQNKCQWILKCLRLKGRNELLHLLGQKGAVILSKFINNRRSDESRNQIPRLFHLHIFWWWFQSLDWQTLSQYLTDLHWTHRRNRFFNCLQKLQFGRKFNVRNERWVQSRVCCTVKNNKPKKSPWTIS